MCINLYVFPLKVSCDCDRKVFVANRNRDQVSCLFVVLVIFSTRCKLRKKIGQFLHINLCHV